MEIDVKIQYRNEKLKAMREAAGMSQSQLANVTGIKVQMIQHYEQGNNDLNVAKLVTILKLTKALNCDLSDILTDPEVLTLLKQKIRRA
jgi:transcriptional regulator with XRE-family HTH domain